jgi:conjugative transfer signal peptidase TraF
MSGHTGTLSVAALGAGLAAVLPLNSPFLVWNASASVPIGLYAVERPTSVRVADLVAVAPPVAPPEALANFLADRGYLPRGVPLLKHVQAVSGQSVCRNGFAVTIDGAAIGEARERDSRGRPLPSWKGCHVVRQDEVFLMNPRSADSLDGRYFGPLPASSVIGHAIPLWTIGED